MKEIFLLFAVVFIASCAAVALYRSVSTYRRDKNLFWGGFWAFISIIQKFILVGAFNTYVQHEWLHDYTEYGEDGGNFTSVVISLSFFGLLLLVGKKVKEHDLLVKARQEEEEEDLSFPLPPEYL